MTKMAGLEGITEQLKAEKPYRMGSAHEQREIQSGGNCYGRIDRIA